MQAQKENQVEETQQEHVTQKKTSGYGYKSPVQTREGKLGVIQSKEGRKPPIAAKQRPVQKQQSQEKATNSGRATLMQQAINIALQLGATITKNSQIPEEMGALATIQGNEIHFKSGEFTLDNLLHELAHLIINKKRSDKIKVTNKINGKPVNTEKHEEAKADALARELEGKLRQGNLNLGDYVPGFEGTGGLPQVMQRQIHDSKVDFNKYYPLLMEKTGKEMRTKLNEGYKNVRGAIINYFLPGKDNSSKLDVTASHLEKSLEQLRNIFEKHIDYKFIRSTSWMNPHTDIYSPARVQKIDFTKLTQKVMTILDERSEVLELLRGTEENRLAMKQDYEGYRGKFSEKKKELGNDTEKAAFIMRGEYMDYQKGLIEKGGSDKNKPVATLQVMLNGAKEGDWTGHAALQLVGLENNENYEPSGEWQKTSKEKGLWSMFIHSGPLEQSTANYRDKLTDEIEKDKNGLGTRLEKAGIAKESALQYVNYLPMGGGAQDGKAQDAMKIEIYKSGAMHEHYLSFKQIISDRQNDDGRGEESNRLHAMRYAGSYTPVATYLLSKNMVGRFTDAILSSNELKQTKNGVYSMAVNAFLSRSEDNCVTFVQRMLRTLGLPSHSSGKGDFDLDSHKGSNTLLQPNISLAEISPGKYVKGLSELSSKDQFCQVGRQALEDTLHVIEGYFQELNVNAKKQ